MVNGLLRSSGGCHRGTGAGIANNSEPIPRAAGVRVEDTRPVSPVTRAPLWVRGRKRRNANALVKAECKKGDRLIYLDVARAMLGDDGKPRRELLAADGLHLNEKG